MNSRVCQKCEQPILGIRRLLGTRFCCDDHANWYEVDLQHLMAARLRVARERLEVRMNGSTLQRHASSGDDICRGL